MVTVFDTSTLVAAHATAHPSFGWADTQIQTAEQPAMCAHSLAECYAVMTSHPQLRYPPAQVEEVLTRLMETWTVLPLGSEDYLAAVARCRQLGLPGGAIYDALIAEAAVKAGAVGLVTLNAKHFVRLGEEIRRIVVTPPSQG